MYSILWKKKKQLDSKQKQCAKWNDLKNCEDVIFDFKEKSKNEPFGAKL